MQTFIVEVNMENIFPWTFIFVRLWFVCSGIGHVNNYFVILFIYFIAFFLSYFHFLSNIPTVFKFFSVSLYKIVDSEYSPGKSLKTSNEVKIKKSKMLRFILDYLEIKKMYKNALKMLPFIIRHFSDWYTTQQMCDQAILENGGTLNSVLDCYKNLKTWNKAVDDNLLPILIRFKRSVIKLLTLALLHWILSLIDLWLNKYVVKFFLKNLLR